jgi:hypothetical protein
MKAITTAAVLALLATGGIAMAEGTATAPATAPATATTAPVEAKKDAAPVAPAADAKKGKGKKKHKM